MKLRNCPIKIERNENFARRGRRITLCLQLVGLLVMFVGAASAETLHKTKMIDGKGREQPVDLAFDGGNSALSVKAAGEEIFHVPYGGIQKLSYELASLPSHQRGRCRDDLLAWRQGSRHAHPSRIRTGSISNMRLHLVRTEP